jgi:hypothetical protein
LACSSLLLEVTNCAANNRGNRTNSRTGNAPAAQNTGQERYTANHVSENPTQSSPVARRKRGHDCRSHHCLSLAFMLFVRGSLGHHFRERLVMGQLVVGNLVCDFVRGFVSGFVLLKFVRQFMLFPLVLAALTECRAGDLA